MGSTFSLSLSQFCIWKRLFPPFGGTLWKMKTMRCPDPPVLQRWCICIYAHHGLEGGDGGAISDIFWITWHIVLWSPEDWGSGKILLCSVSGSNWLYQKHRIIVGISKQSLSWGHLTQRHSPWHHTQIPVLSLTQPVPLWFGHFFYFYPLNFPTVFLSRGCVGVSIGDVCFLVLLLKNLIVLSLSLHSLHRQGDPVSQGPREDVS